MGVTFILDPTEERYAALQPCCDSWRLAHASGTDNAAYGSLVAQEDRYPYIGCELPQVEYCPWCGDEKRYMRPEIV